MKIIEKQLEYLSQIQEIFWIFGLEKLRVIQSNHDRWTGFSKLFRGKVD